VVGEKRSALFQRAIPRWIIQIRTDTGNDFGKSSARGRNWFYPIPIYNVLFRPRIYGIYYCIYYICRAYIYKYNNTVNSVWHIYVCIYSTYTMCTQCWFAAGRSIHLCKVIRILVFYICWLCRIVWIPRYKITSPVCLRFLRTFPKSVRR